MSVVGFLLQLADMWSHTLRNTPSCLTLIKSAAQYMRACMHFQKGVACEIYFHLSTLQPSRFSCGRRQAHESIILKYK